MKIEQLQQLLTIVEKGSINEAAYELYIARSALSASMKKLEAELGELLFVRNSKGVCLTPFGTYVYHQAQEICGRADFLRNISPSRVKNTLNISSTYCSMANVAFLELLKQQESVILNASIEESSLDTVINRVKVGLADIGIATLFSNNEAITRRKLESLDMTFTELTERKLGVIIGPKNPLFYEVAEEVELAALQQYPHLENFATPIDHSWEWRNNSSADHKPKYSVSDLALALRLINDTDAVMIDGDDINIYQSLYGYHNIRFLSIRDYPPCHTGWIKKKNAELSESAQSFLHILTQITEKAH